MHKPIWLKVIQKVKFSIHITSRSLHLKHEFFIHLSKHALFFTKINQNSFLQKKLTLDQSLTFWSNSCPKSTIFFSPQDLNINNIIIILASHDHPWPPYTPLIKLLLNWSSQLELSFLALKMTCNSAHHAYIKTMPSEAYKTKP